MNKDLKENQATAAAHVPLFEEEDSHSDDFNDSDLSSNENWQRLLIEETFEMEIDADNNKPRSGPSSAPYKKEIRYVICISFRNPSWPIPTLHDN